MGIATKAAAAKITTIQIPRIEGRRVSVPIIGTSPLIPGKFSEKAREMMRVKQQGGAAAAREPKDPETEADSRTYFLEDGRMGVPSVNFKCAIVDACRFYPDLKMTDMKRMVYVSGEGPTQLVPIDGPFTIEEDMVRNQTGVADIRYRRYIWPWKAVLTVTLRGMSLNDQSLINLIEASGQCGVCEWRPSSPKSASGIYGMYQVDPDAGSIKVERI